LFLRFYRQKVEKFRGQNHRDPNENELGVLAAEAAQLLAESKEGGDDDEEEEGDFGSEEDDEEAEEEGDFGEDDDEVFCVFVPIHDPRHNVLHLTAFRDDQILTF